MCVNCVYLLYVCFAYSCACVDMCVRLVWDFLCHVWLRICIGVGWGRQPARAPSYRYCLSFFLLCIANKRCWPLGKASWRFGVAIYMACTKQWLVVLVAAYMATQCMYTNNHVKKQKNDQRRFVSYVYIDWAYWAVYAWSPWEMWISCQWTSEFGHCWTPHRAKTSTTHARVQEKEA